MSNSGIETNWTDPDDAPELTEEWFAKATFKVGETVVRPGEPRTNKGGRPRGSGKEQVTLRLDKAALAVFRAGGPGWQTRVNEAVRKAAGL